MKNISAATFALSITFALLFSSYPTIAQNTGVSDPGPIVSFNGKFMNPEPGQYYRSCSGNGLFAATYDIGLVTDENRELKNFKLYKNDELLYTLSKLPGADFYISNSGYVAVMNMDLHFQQILTIYLLDPQGNQVSNHTYRYASVFGFSPLGNKFVAGTDAFLNIIDLDSGTAEKMAPCSQFAFSQDETYLVTAWEGMMTIYRNNQLEATLQTDLFYPRAVAVSSDLHQAFVIGKKNMKCFDLENFSLTGTATLSENLSYRDLKISDGQIYAGVHYRKDGISKGLLYTYDKDAVLTGREEKAIKTYQTFENSYKSNKNSNNYESIPWPFVPFDEVHKVWNHYEQHMGDGTDYWAYLHQGLDLETPIAEPTYAVQAGYVKLVLTIGGDIYWRVAVSPEQSSGYSDGWLYAHLIPSSIQVDVGDYVELHDYLGDIIAWTSDWGHIHFVNIHDHGEIWYYNDDEWGINFNPLLALDPITDDVAPEIYDFSGSSKFGFLVNQGYSFLDPMALSGDVDIIARISDFHGDSEWEQPAFKTYYQLNKLPENTVIIPKTLGQILNHTYPMYNSGFYESYASILYFKDNSHPSPPWMNTSRDYYQILTNNNGDSIIDLSEANLALNTDNYADGMYRLYVEAWDEFGNMAIDSQDIVFDNFNTGVGSQTSPVSKVICFPNPVNDVVSFRLNGVNQGSIKIYDAAMRLMDEITISEFNTGKDITLCTEGLSPGIYLYNIETAGKSVAGKFVKK
ncbi:MAG: T9SS type A sorting domain-containing protein [Bacteroidetes bacterium]|nr:T9SS type A sorting domain-containing protein [Bacteroidota bacterium]